MILEVSSQDGVSGFRHWRCKTQQNAEALFGIALTQLARKGAPVFYGSYTSNVDMRSGAPAFGTPENTKANIASGQLARRYEKLVMDVEMLQQMIAFLDPIEVNEAELAFDAM